MKKFITGIGKNIKPSVAKQGVKPEQPVARPLRLDEARQGVKPVAPTKRPEGLIPRPPTKGEK